MSRLLAPFVAVLASSVVWACDGSGSGTGTVDPVVTQQDAPVATTSGDGSIPSSACWKYDSATISANDVNRWNNLSAEWDTSRAPPHKIDWFDDNQKSIKFLKNFEQQTPRMTASGLFTPTWKPGELNKHTSVEFYGDACSSHIDTDRTLLNNKRYRVGFDMCIPRNAGDWNEGFIAIQVWGDGQSNPPISFHFDGRSGTTFKLFLRGDTRPTNRSRIFGRRYEFYDVAVLATNVHGKCHHVEFQFVLDRFPNGKGEFTMWLNGSKVYDSKAKFGGPIQLGYAGATYMPSIGLYAFGGSATTMSGVTYDKIWFMAS